MIWKDKEICLTLFSCASCKRISKNQQNPARLDLLAQLQFFWRLLKF